MAAPSAFQLDEFVQPEVDLQAQSADAFDKLLRPPAQWTAIGVGHVKLTGQQGARLLRVGVKRSWPDTIVLWPGFIVGIEWKNADGELSRSRWVSSKSGRRRWVIGQREMHPLLRAAGMKLYVCTSIEQSLMILDALGCPMLKWRVAA